MFPKLGTELLEFLELVWAVRDRVWTVWAVCVVIYALNHVLMCMRPELAMDFGFTRWNQCWMIGREQQPKGFTVHLNSVHEIFCEKMSLVE